MPDERAVGDKMTTLTDQTGLKQPKYLNIVENLRTSIASGQYKNGSRLPSETELVRKYGVSRMTVVKAMQHLQSEGVLVRRTGSGSFASSGLQDKKPVFGLLIPDLGETEIFEPICKGMARSADGHGHFLSWGHSDAHNQDKEEDAEHLCRQFIDQRITGVFFAPLEFGRCRDQVNHRILSMLRAAHVPVVLLDRCVLQYPERSDYDLVGLDNRRAGFVVADHLIRQGAKCVAFLSEPGSAETVDDRIAGYREAHFVHGLKAEKHMLLASDGSDAAFLEAALSGHRIDAIQCANDHTAAKLMRSLLSLGVRIPEDVRVAGVDDVKYAGLLPVPLTTFHQPCLEIGAAAVSAMKERVNNPRLAARSIALNGYLVVRQSCGAALGSSESAKKMVSDSRGR